MYFDRINVTLIKSYCYIKHVLQNYLNLYGPRGLYEPALMLAPTESSNILHRLWYNQLDSNGPSSAERSFLGNIFFAVPKQRKTIERRLKGRFGDDKWAPHGSKMIKRRHDLITCETCGNYREKLRLCLHCFNRVEGESKVIKEAIARQYGVDPVEKPVEIQYKDDPKSQVTGEILIEIDRDRPVWFNKGLLQRANEIISETNVIDPVNRSKN